MTTGCPHLQSGDPANCWQCSYPGDEEAAECFECGASAVGPYALRRIANHHCGGNSLRTAANALADARVRFAQEFARQKLLTPGMTDKAAIYAATEVTKDEVTRLEAELEIARRTS